MFKKHKIVIIDYGFGNLFSLKNALDYLGANAVLSDDPKDIRSADSLILPGVGAFGNGIKNLKKKGFVEPIMEHARSGKKILGICLGMQFLFDSSEEFGRHKGLGLIEGIVKKIPQPKNNGYKIPHIGWNKLLIPSHIKTWKETILSKNIKDPEFYFVHSYVGYTKNKEDILAHIRLGKNLLAAAVQKNNIIGVQFHPEKSGEEGLKILNQFVKNS